MNDTPTSRPSSPRLPGAARRKPQAVDAPPPRDTSSAASCRPILVLGVDRSGTSLLTNLVTRWGAHAGSEAELGPSDTFNPSGYFEHQPMQQLLSMLRREAGVTFFDPAFPSLLSNLATRGYKAEEAQDLIRHMEAPGKPWVWKEPNFCLFLAFWQEILEDPIYLVTVRNPLHSARSYEKFMLPDAWRGPIRLTAYFLLRWQFFLVSIMRDTHQSSDRLFVRYESLLEEPEKQSARICKFLDDRCGGSENTVADRIERMAGVVQPDLWRHRGDRNLADTAEASEAQKRLYRYLLDRLEAGDFDDFDPAEFPFPSCAEEYLSNFGTLTALLASEALESLEIDSK